MRPSLGSRVAQFLLRLTQRCAAGSTELASERRLRDQMAKGGHRLLTGVGCASRYGEQTGHCHGGLLFTRSPTRFWLEGQGMLRDVDMSGCYNAIISGMNVYWGRPVVYEPGRRSLTLREAVKLVRRHAADDAWYLRVTGDPQAALNVLIPSTLNAVTSDNYRKRGRWSRTPSGSKLFAARVESGVVTLATWRMIQALPRPLRREYEALNADSIVFYPREMVAASGAEFDDLRTRDRQEGLPWQAELDLTAMQHHVIEYLDADYVSLAFPIGRHARRVGRLRREEQQQHGKGSGADTAMKLLANTMYGVLVCRHLPTNNIVAANRPRASSKLKSLT
jgi:hypothetical protein